MLPPPDVRGIYRSDTRSRSAYAEGAGIYRILPQAICLPADTADLATLVRWAAEHRVALTPRGAGSAMGGGNVGQGVVVDLTRMAGRRLVLDSAAGRAVTSSAVTAAELNAASAPHGLRLPPDPSSGRWATLGGMVSTNAAGARSVRYGSVRRWVERLALVTADGETVTLGRGHRASSTGTGALTRLERDAAPAIRAAATLIQSRFPRTRKNSSGYALDAYLASGDIVDLVIGAEGTLGIVTEVEWRLDTIPSCRAGLRVSLSSLDQLGHVVAALSRHQPSALELLDRTFLDLVASGALAGSGVEPDSDAILLVELERDDDGSLQRSLADAASAVRPWASVQVASSPDEADRLWAIRHAASPILAGLPDDRRSMQVIEDACVPLERMAEYIRFVRRAAGERNVPVVMFGHAGDGHIHVNLLPEIGRAGWESAVAGLLDEVTEAVIRLGGTLSGEHGDGRLRAGALGGVYGPEIIELFHLVKRAFDPLGIFNPGIILPCPAGPHAGEPPISRLKVGANAVSLPPDIQRGLREIELSGGYGRCRLELASEEGLGSRV